MTGRHYDDLRLTLQRVPAALEIEGSSSHGETTSPARVSFDDRRAEALAQSLAQLEEKELLGGALLQFGTELASLLLPDDVRQLFLRSLKSVGPLGGVRLVLDIRDSLLSSVPWEFTYVQGTSDHLNFAPFLSLDPRISIVRYERSDRPLPSVRPLRNGQLRVLLIDARNVPGTKALADDVPALIQDALRSASSADFVVDVEQLSSPTVEQIRTTLQASTFDVVQFVGHAVAGSDGGSLLLPDGADQVRVGGYEVAEWLREGDVRIAVLSACNTGERSAAAGWTGVSGSLIASGIPAVIAMQHQIESSHAAVFEAGLYAGFAAGLSLDEAVSLGRRRIPGVGLLPEWGVPVLYTRSDGVVFSATSSDSATALRNELQAPTLDLSLGQRLEDEGAWDRAADFYAKVIFQLQGGRALALAQLRRGVCLWRDGEPLAAEDSFDRAKELATQLGDHILLGEVYLEQGIQAEAEDRLDDAELMFQRAERELRTSDTHWVRVKLSMARLRARFGEVRTAVELIRDLKAEALPLQLQAEYWDTMGSLLVTRGEFAKAVTALETALKLDEQLDAKSEIAHTRLLLARAYLGVGDRDRSLGQIDAATESFERVMDEEGLSEAWALRGQVHEDAGELVKAIRMYTKAGDFDVAAHDRGGEARVNRLLGRTARKRGDHDSAEQYFTQARDLLRSSRDDDIEWAALLTEEALLDVDMGDFVEARSKLEQALGIAEQDEDDRAKAIAKRHLATAVREMGEPDRAIELLHDAEPVLRDLGDERELEALFDELGECYLEKGTFDKSIEALKKSEEMDDRRKSARESGRTQLLLGKAYLQMGERSLASEHLERALELCEESQDEVAKSNALFELGVFHSQNGHVKEARRHLRDALSIDRRLADRTGAARCNRMLASLSRREHDFERAAEYLGDAEDEIGKTRDRKEQALLHLERGHLELERGGHRRAADEASTARKEFLALDAHLEVTSCDRVEAAVRASQHDFETALSLLLSAEETLKELRAFTELSELYDELGSVYLAHNDLPSARIAVEKSLELDRRSGWESSQGRSHLLRGEIERRSGNFDQARGSYNEAAEAFATARDALGAAEVKVRLGDWHVDGIGHARNATIEEAIRSYREARSLFQRNRDAVGTARCYRKLAEIYARNNEEMRAQEAIENAEDAIDRANDGDASGLEREAAAVAFTKAMLCTRRGEYEESLLHFDEALSAYKRQRREDKVNDVLRKKAAAHQHLGQVELSLQCIRQIGLEQGRIFGMLLDQVDETVGSAVSGPYRDGEYLRVFERSGRLVEEWLREFQEPDSKLAHSLRTIGEQWRDVVETLAVGRPWQPSSVDALSAAGLVHLLRTLSESTTEPSSTPI